MIPASDRASVYALGSDMIEFDPFGPTWQDQDPDLAHAYELVLDEMDAPGSSLDHWRQLTAESDSTHLPTPSSSPTCVFTIEDDSSDDECMKMAKEISLAALQTNTKRAGVTTSTQKLAEKPCNRPQPDLSFLGQSANYKGKGKEKASPSRPGPSQYQPNRGDYIDDNLHVMPVFKNTSIASDIF